MANEDQKDQIPEVKTILVSQPKPEYSPYYKLEDKYGIQIDWRPFIHVEPVPEKEFRKTRIKPDDYTAIILTSRNSIDHFFNLWDVMRIKMPEAARSFRLSAAIANYLQECIVYRKRKVFVGKKSVADLENAVKNHKKEKLLLPTSNLASSPVQ